MKLRNDSYLENIFDSEEDNERWCHQFTCDYFVVRLSGSSVVNLRLQIHQIGIHDHLDPHGWILDSLLQHPVHFLDHDLKKHSKYQSWNLSFKAKGQNYVRLVSQ